jgi:divalent metal cation (Fe/Co/Zn/Cd) transporter
MLTGMDTENNRPATAQYYRTAYLLAVLTTFYNLAEGVVSVWFGYADATLTLFGFGVDSLVEVVSSIGVWHMISRIQASPDAGTDAFEQRALRITGGSFYALSIGLLVSACLNLYQQHKPETTVWGVIIAGIAIISMWLLMHYKMKVGRLLGSKAILADAACSRVCLYLSIILLVTSSAYELTGIGSLDAIGTIFIAWFSWKEGREALQKARGISCCCGSECS